MPMKYFPSAVVYVIALDNRLPNHRGMSPIDAFLHPSGTRKGKITLAPFGCRALAARPADLRRKKDLVQRRDDCVLLGLASGSKNGYLLLKMSTLKTIVAHDVRFHPSIFPFQDAIDIKERADVHEDLVDEFYREDPDLSIPSSELLEDSAPAPNSQLMPMDEDSSPDVADSSSDATAEEAPSNAAPADEAKEIANDGDKFDSFDEEDEDDNMDASPDMFVQSHAFFCKHNVRLRFKVKI